MGEERVELPGAFIELAHGVVQAGDARGVAVPRERIVVGVYGLRLVGYWGVGRVGAGIFSEIGL